MGDVHLVHLRICWPGGVYWAPKWTFPASSYRNESRAQEKSGLETDQMAIGVKNATQGEYHFRKVV